MNRFVLILFLADFLLLLWHVDLLVVLLKDFIVIDVTAEARMVELGLGSECGFDSPVIDEIFWSVFFFSMGSHLLIALEEWLVDCFSASSISSLSGRIRVSSGHKPVEVSIISCHLVSGGMSADRKFSHLRKRHGLPKRSHLIDFWVECQFLSVFLEFHFFRLFVDFLARLFGLEVKIDAMIARCRHSPVSHSIFTHVCLRVQSQFFEFVLVSFCFCPRNVGGLIHSVAWRGQVSDDIALASVWRLSSELLSPVLSHHGCFSRKFGLESGLEHCFFVLIS